MESDPETLQLYLKEIVERFSLMLGVLIAPLLEHLLLFSILLLLELFAAVYKQLI